MKNYSLKLLLIVFVLFFVFQTTAQEKIIHGVITTFDSIPLIGASIKVLSTKQTVISDTLGNFSVRCSSKDKLKVTAAGFFDQKVKLTSITRIVAVNLKLKPGEKNREYAIGYGHVTDEEKINALASINEDDTDFSQYTNMYDLIRGRVAGVQIVNNELRIRGTTTITGGNALRVLIIVDGVAHDNSILNTLPPVMVKNISVIKDASASIYGTRAANGVLIIETKR